MKRSKLKHMFSVILIFSLMISALHLAVSAQEPALITTRTDFEKALDGAEDGDVLLVGDIDFNINAVGAVNEAERIAVDKSVTEQSAEPVAATKIVNTRYTDEEIDSLINNTEEIQKLTDRELDVLRELLKGKKQGEISYYLGITVNTVKEYTRKVYGRLGVANKQELFDLIDSKLRKD